MNITSKEITKLENATPHNDAWCKYFTARASVVQERVDRLRKCGNIKPGNVQDHIFRMVADYQNRLDALRAGWLN